MGIKSVSVFCGSKLGSNDLFSKHAFELGVFLSSRDIKVICGGSSNGLMNSLAEGVLSTNGKVTGIVPIYYNQTIKETLSEKITVPDLIARKKLMNEMADAIVILPGSYGTLDELFEMLSLTQMELNHKPIVILNSANYFKHLIMFFDKMVDCEFLSHKYRAKLLVCENVSDLINILDI